MPDFIEIFPASDGRPLSPLVAAQFTSCWARDAHQTRHNFGTVHALGVWAVENVTVAGDESYLFLEGERFAGPSIVPTYVEDEIAKGEARPHDALSLPERVIEAPVVAFMGWGQNVFGHALIEMAPKIRIAARALGKAPKDLSFILPTNASGWFRQLMALAGARRFIEYDQARERLLLRRAFVPTLPRDIALHPACDGIFAAMRPPQPASAGEAVFVTRRNANVTRPIHMLNALQIARCAERAGLRVVSPEQAPVADQARMFAGARLVVGEYGSGLMNAIFCKPGTVVGAIGTRSELLSVISALGGLRQSYFDPTGDPADPAGYTVDASAFARWLDALQNEAERPGNPPIEHAAAIG